EDPYQLVAARKGSPLVIGIGKNEYFVASDATPIVEYTNEVVYLNDHEIAVINTDSLSIKTVEDIPTTPYIHTLEMALEAIEKGGYDHFMLKEIFEQPRSIRDCMRGRLDAESNRLVLGGIREYTDTLAQAERIIIAACGTSWHAGLVAAFPLVDAGATPVEDAAASDIRSGSPTLRCVSVPVGISQSRDPADTLAAFAAAKSTGASIIGVCHVVGSSIARASHAGS